MSTQVTNAVIKQTFIGFEQGVLGVYLGVHVGGDQLVRIVNLQVELDETPSYAGDLIRNILEIVGVDAWERLPERAVRIKIEEGNVIAVGNLLTDNWLDFKKFVAEYEADEYEIVELPEYVPSAEELPLED
jgi:hypothetical protein